MTTEQLLITADVLSSKIKERSATIGVVGMGYVGLPLAVAVFEEKYSVIGFDVDPSKIEALQTGTPYLKHLGDDFAAAMANSKRFVATDSVDALADADTGGGAIAAACS